MNDEVPDCATVPSWLMRSSLDMPQPRSRSVSVFASLSAISFISSLAMSPSPSADGSVSDMKRVLSSASEPFEMSSRKKISFFE
eukprot:jgi/Chrpa1/19643/Chrysochromulina_OHIO_Genome00009362-RA